MVKRSMLLETPVIFIIFNRPHTTARVFQEIAKAKPRKLFVVADGPRDGVQGDVERCQAARAIIERVDWDCEVRKNYSDVNLGCGKRPATGINWVFEHVDRAIILEDDCVPNLSFFRFCDELLEKYRHHENIMQICGNHFGIRSRDFTSNYNFSMHNICAGGWATWQRAWKYFDPEVKQWETLRETSWLKDLVDNPLADRYWREMFDLAFSRKGEVSFWDYQWTFACWVNNGLSIIPQSTLVSNIGFGPGATHTKAPDSPMANLRAFEMTFPLVPPPKVERDEVEDMEFIERVVVPKVSKQLTLSQRLRRKLSGLAMSTIKNHLS